MSGVLSIASISAAQYKMLRSEHETKLGIRFTSVWMISATIFNSLSSSILLIHTATRFLDILLLSSSSLGITGSWIQAFLYLIFLMFPCLLTLMFDRFLFSHQPNIVEDDLQLRKQCVSFVCRIKDILSGYAKTVLDGLNEKLRLPMCT